MKILIISSLYHPHNRGGGEISIKTIAEALIANGHEVTVLATGGTKGLTLDVVNGVRVWRAKLKNTYWHHEAGRQPAYKRMLWHIIDIYNPFMVKYAKTVLETETPDIIQIHALQGWSSSIVRWAVKQKLPTIQVLHGYEMVCPNARTFRNGQRCVTQCVTCKVMRLPHRHYSKMFSAVVGISNAVVARQAGFGYYENVPLRRTIYNARNPEMIGLTKSAKVENKIDIKNTPNTHYPVDAARDRSKTRFGFMGSLNYSKGVELLLEVFAQSAPPNTELWIAGMGDDAYVLGLKAKYEASNITFVGKSFPAQFYRDIDVAVVPSIWDEPLGVVVFEALAFGCPVIASTRGGIPEMIQPGIDGLLFDPDRPKELADAISRLATDTGLRKRMSEAAPISAQRFLSVSRIAGDYEELYGAVLAAQ